MALTPDTKRYIIIGLCIAILISIISSSVYFYAFPQQSSIGIKNTTSNLIVAENQKPGTEDWKVTNGAVSGVIQAYAGEDSINKGDSVHLYVSTIAKNYTIQIFRLGYYGGKGGRLVSIIPKSIGISQGYYLGSSGEGYPVACSSCITSQKDQKGQETDITDANWKETNTILFSNSWLSGIYEIKLTENDGGFQWVVPVVLRDDTRKANFVFEDPMNTDQAYNAWGGVSLYQDNRTSTLKHGLYVSYNRPYFNDFGGGSLFVWTYPTIRYIESQGYDIAYTSNNAVEEGRTLLSNYRGMVISGHDEYMSQNERSAIQQALSNGMSLANFAANSIYWQIRYLPDARNNLNRTIICYKDLPTPPYIDPYNTPTSSLQGLTTSKWRDNPINKPEDLILKSMYSTYGGGKSPQSQDFFVTNTSSWIFKGTNLKNGDKIPGILGYEVDSIYNDGSITSDDNITVIGKSPYKDINNNVVTSFALVDEVKSTHSIIFNAGTIFWPLALTDFKSHWDVNINPSIPLQTITHNILSRMSSNVPNNQLPHDHFDIKTELTGQNTILPTDD